MENFAEVVSLAHNVTASQRTSGAHPAGHSEAVNGQDTKLMLLRAQTIRPLAAGICCILLGACLPHLPEAASEPPPPDSYRVEAFEIGDGDVSRTVRGALVTSAFFPALNARPLLGRLFTRKEHQAETSRVVLLSHSFWQERLGGQPDRIGTLLQVNGQPLTIIGVLPNSFHDPLGVDLWLPGADVAR